ncbi:ParB N-terminal domain-containing protein [Xanthomonas sp. 3498]|uniref:ParB/RepB/Spo0J family partition protein n=1 Tax=Xanthomonas sp. 3498 TaxID=2663863 RepID=UPI00160BAE3C|nr:ParB N-terminal domain-containing protein [Xanthomonas sp. 3498]MBB5875847.1 ParB-like chromosome segregation protein Spo0J [Xanthomonas sp. 3498]
MSAPSFKQLVKDGTARRADALKFRIEDIHEEPGFNLRDPLGIDENGVTFEESIEQLKEYILAGGVLPPLEVRPRPGGGVFVVEGHRRRLAYLRAGDAIRDPSGDLWISVIPFLGNDVQRTSRMLSSAKGRKLAPLETARGYARLAAFNWSPEEIAQDQGVSRVHVDNMLILWRANEDVKNQVRNGTIAATAAVDLVRHRGEEAGELIASAAEAAKAAGKKRVTPRMFRPKPLPRKIVTALDDVTAQIDKALPEDVRAALQAGEVEHVTLPAEIIKQLIEIRERIPSREEPSA